MHGTFYLGNKGQDYLAPLYLYPTEKEKAFGATERVPNFSDEFIEEFSNKLGLEFARVGGQVRTGSGSDRVSAAQNYPVATASGSDKDAKTFTPEDVFHYAYAVFHSPTYRARYAEFLKIDFPRLPLTTDRKLFRKLCASGAKLVALHLLEAVDAPADWKLSEPPAVAGGSTTDKYASQSTANPSATADGSDKTVAAGFPKKELFEIDAHGKGKVYINKTTRFDGVPETVWIFPHRRLPGLPQMAQRPQRPHALGRRHKSLRQNRRRAS